jgi:activator of HSP90 ATPase
MRITMKTKSIRQAATFNATPAEVYKLIMDPKTHAAFTGTRVTMSNKVNGKFSVFDGYAKGYNIELAEGKKIVQAWHFAEDGWPDDHYSICTFLFESVDGKTRLKFIQTGVPEHKVEELKEGWKQYYWNPIKTFLRTVKDNPV